MVKKILTVITTIISLLFPTKESVYIKDHIIDISFIPVNIYWIDDSNILLCSYSQTFIYNTITRGKNEIETCEKCIYGFDQGLVYCKYEHRVISSTKEFSTTIYVYDSRAKLLYERNLFPTVLPYKCTKRYISLRPAYSFLERKEYVLDISKDSFKEVSIESKQKIFNGITKKSTVISEKVDLERLIVLDEYNRIWVYVRE